MGKQRQTWAHVGTLERRGVTHRAVEDKSWYSDYEIYLKAKHGAFAW